jgi:hypothetical protein
MAAAIASMSSIALTRIAAGAMFMAMSRIIGWSRRLKNCQTIQVGTEERGVCAASAAAGA